MRFFLKTCVAAAVFSAFNVGAANINESDFAYLKQAALGIASTPVVVSFFAPSLEEIHRNKAVLNERTNSAAAALFAELGDGALAGGRWSNEVGQIGFYVNAAGLQKLKASKNAVRAWPGANWASSSHIIDSDGSLSDIESALSAGQTIDVEVFVNVDGLDFKVEKTGKPVITNSKENHQNALAIAGQLIAKTEGLSSKTSHPMKVVSDSLQDGGSVVLRVSKNEVLDLARDPNVRAIKRVGFVRSKAPTVTPGWEEYINKRGLTEMVVELVSPLNAGRVDGKSIANQSRVHERLAQDVLGDMGFSARPKKVLSNLGIVIVSLEEGDVAKLVNSKDPRIKAISPNRPIAEPKLNYSVEKINVPKWRNLGYGGAGQTVAIFDMGIQKDHEFMKNASGVSRVTYEGCFGTNTVIGVNIWASPCGDPSTNGDSEDYVANQGGLLTTSQCVDAFECSHGTQVAGIAAGRRSDGLYGVAPDANIASIKVVSYEVNRALRVRFFEADMLAAAERLVGAVQNIPFPAPYTVNMSIGGGLVYTGSCDGVAAGFKGAFDALKAKGIPVVIATGNYGTGVEPMGSNWGINWPSCISGVTKVSSVDNYGDNKTISNLSNYFKTGVSFAGEYQFFAPGASVYSSIKSTISGGYSGASGTSFAAPHVTGIYALLKQGMPTMSVEGLSALIAEHSLKFQATACTGQQTGCGPQEAMSVYMP